MQHRAGQVEYTPHAATVLIGEPFARAACKHSFGQLQRGQLTVASRLAQLLQQVAQGGQQGMAAIALLQRLASRVAQQLVHGRKADATHGG